MATETLAQPLTYSEAVAAEVRAAIARRGLSGSAFARRVGVNQTYISVRLRGVVSIDVHDLELFAGALQVDPADLLPRGWVKPSPDPAPGGDAVWAPRGSNPQPADYKFASSNQFVTLRSERLGRPTRLPQRPAAPLRPRYEFAGNVVADVRQVA